MRSSSCSPKRDRNVLVALWPKARDLELARERGFYRVRPGAAVDRLGDLSRFHTIAFYQPDAFGPDARRIRFRAPVLAYERRTRAELLPEERDHVRSSALYHCFRLGELEELPRPEAPHARPVHHFLDFALFCRERQLDVECDGDTWHLGAESARRDRQRDNRLEASGWHILRFSTEDIQRDLSATLHRVREAINRYGGIEEEPGVVRRYQKDGRLGPGQGSLDLFE